jgi:hypothetical protein
MTTTPTPLYYDNCLLTEDDLPNLAAEHKIPFTDLQKACEQIRSKGEVLYSLYPNTTRERLRTFAASITFEPDEALDYTPGEDPTPCLVVNSPQEAATTSLVTVEAHTDAEAVQSPLKPRSKAKKSKLEESVFDLAAELYDEEENDESTEPAPVTQRDEVVESASVALMQAMVGDSASFIITEEGICSINPAHPPTLVHSYQVVSSVLRLSDLSDKVNDKGCWMLGSILAALEDYHGENFNVGQVCEQTEKAENTIRTALSVFKAFKDKRYNLSFSSHKEGFHMKAPLEVKKLILHKAETYELTTKQIRALGSVYRAMEDDTTIRNIRSKQQALDLVSAVESVKVKWLVYEDGRMVELTRTDGSTPDGQMAINLKDKVFFINGEKAGEVERIGVKKAVK